MVVPLALGVTDGLEHVRFALPVRSLKALQTSAALVQEASSVPWAPQPARSASQVTTASRNLANALHVVLVVTAS